MSGSTIPIDEVSVTTLPSGKVGIGNVGSGTVAIPGLGTFTLANLLSGVSPIVLASNAQAYTQLQSDNSTKPATTAFVKQAVNAVIPYPSAGVVYSSGTSFATVQMGTGVSLTGSELSATGVGLGANITADYTFVATDSGKSFYVSATAVTLTLPTGLLTGTPLHLLFSSQTTVNTQSPATFVGLEGTPATITAVAGDFLSVLYDGANWRVTACSPDIWQTYGTVTGKSLSIAGNGIITGTLSTDGTANTLTIAGSASGSPATLAASGTDTNVGVNIETKGSGAVTINGVGLATVPSTGLVYSNGTVLSDAVIGTGLSLTGNTLAATGTSGGGSSYNVATPANGGSLTIGTFAGLFYTQQINPTETVTSLTVTLPSSPPDGQRLTIASNSSMSGIVITPNSSQTLGPNIPTAIKAGTGFTLQIQAGVWERVQ